MTTVLQETSNVNYESIILNTVSDVIITTDLNFIIHKWNKSAEKFYEIPAFVAIGKSLPGLTNLKFLTCTVAEAHQQLAANGIWKGDVSFVTPSGKEYFFSHTVQYIFDEDQNKIGYLSVGRDITEKKKAEANLAQSEQFYRTLIADSLDVTLLVHPDGKITFCSPSIKRILGYDTEELEGKNAFQFVHPDDLSWATESFQREVVENPVIKFIVVRLRKKSGEWIWCMVRGHNLMANPYINRIAIYFHDDTLRKQANDALKESEKKFRHMIKDLQTGILVQDKDGNILMSNKAMEKMLNVSEEEMIGRRICRVKNIVIGEDGKRIPKHKRPTAVAIQTKKLVENYIMGSVNPETNKRNWLLINSNPILDDEGNLIQVISSAIDITERKKLQDKYILDKVRHQRQLTQATINGQENEKIQIGKELHDNIGQQLTTIKLFLDLARSTADNTTLEMINLATKGVSDVINEVRALSRSLVPSSIKDIGLVESVFDLIENISKGHDIKISLSANTFKEKGISELQKVSFYRILQEQLNNIIKHSTASKVSIHLGHYGSKASLIIKDNGKGFDMNKPQKGIGLSNIRSRIELLNGTTEIESSPGNGCSVKIIIPVTNANASKVPMMV